MTYLLEITDQQIVGGALVLSVLLLLYMLSLVLAHGAGRRAGRMQEMRRQRKLEERRTERFLESMSKSEHVACADARSYFTQGGMAGATSLADGHYWRCALGRTCPQPSACMIESRCLFTAPRPTDERFYE